MRRWLALRGWWPAALAAVLALGAFAAVAWPFDDDESAGDDGARGGERIAACLPPERIEQIRRDPSSAAAVFGRCEPALEAEMEAAGIPAGSATTRAVFAMAAAHRFAPYGSSTALRYGELAGEKGLDCDNYAALTYHLYRRAGGTAPMQFLGWNGGAVGNHAQVWVEDVLLDPTIGLAAAAPLESVLRGEPAKRLLDLSAREVSGGEFNDTVRDAIRAGDYRERDVIYWTEGLPAYVSITSSIELDGELKRSGLGPGVLALRTG